MPLAITPDAIIEPQIVVEVPDSLDVVVDSLGKLGEGINAGGWATAAVVYAWTEEGINQYKVPDEKSPSITLSDFADLRIRGLTTRDSVRKYRGRWDFAVGQGWAEPAEIGLPVKLPIQDFNKVHVQTSGENEWYTPAKYIEAARRVMGGIDLDPFSSDKANEIVQATVYYTKANSGLEHAWAGRVWMNPPYSSKLIWPACERLCEFVASGDVPEAIVLTNNTTETAAVQRMAELASAYCFHSRRIKYLNEDLEEAETPVQGQMFIYFGPNVDRFAAEFVEFGFIVTPI